jgi:predicted alpha/beta-fold hydrolase
MRSKLTLFIAAVMTFLIAVFAGALFYLSDLLIFPFKPREKWTAVETIECSKWMDEWAYADLTDGGPGKKPVDLSCQDSLVLPGQSFYVNNSSGERIHYKVYDNIAPEQKPASDLMPLFLHVHGVSGTHMHGARYFKMAQRLGFQLVAMDLSNHGLSDHNNLGASYGCREQHDVVAVINALKEQFPGRRILAHGTSMGSMALLNASATVMTEEALNNSKSIYALVLENPIPSVEQLTLNTPKKPNVPQSFIAAGVWLAGKRARVDFNSCQPVDAAPKVTVPTYILNAVNDDIVQPEVSAQVVAAIPKENVFRVKVFNKGAHSAVWNGQPREVEQDLLDLWKTALPTVPAVPASGETAKAGQ